ncbi:2-oxo-4-hydroxy-4-carboxy-5-ureidoimidazoline decarboxylase [Bagarius yarrelli]|uniref:2-oxo-4-hydroxy-4-carboxy-5-ureidoimidazoline decarboxylase n=1 Tax=Bagarius yarrelli TaxID=175774 RepID=A0A556TWK4_BAGYA|nr:2-oxo-4-hydroxy-4-carboxy-5-ureidoimidazoline decarboxylase [Bagarius yarrelli]
MDINAVNALSYEDFLEVFGNVIEKCPIIPAAVWTHRPFSGLEDIEAHISNFINSLPESGKEGILRCHPDLAGRELHSGALTRDSQEEQRAAGFTHLQPEEVSRMRSLNSEYKARFGFPFVICARLNTKRDIMRELLKRLGNDRETERTRAIGEVKKICALRLSNLVLHDPPNSEKTRVA